MVAKIRRMASNTFRTGHMIDNINIFMRNRGKPSEGTRVQRRRI